MKRIHAHILKSNDKETFFFSDKEMLMRISSICCSMHKEYKKTTDEKFFGLFDEEIYA
jgi:hypothetical protein